MLYLYIIKEQQKNKDMTLQEIINLWFGPEKRGQFSDEERKVWAACQKVDEHGFHPNGKTSAKYFSNADKKEFARRVKALLK